jgi:hypothetical protein
MEILIFFELKVLLKIFGEIQGFVNDFWRNNIYEIRYR